MDKQCKKHESKNHLAKSFITILRFYFKGFTKLGFDSIEPCFET